MDPINDPPLSLHQSTLDLFEEAKQTMSISDIARLSCLPDAWLRKLPSIPHPSVNRIQHLYEVLTKHRSC